MRAGGFDNHAVEFHARDAAHLNSAMARRATVYNRLMIGAGHKERAESARIHLFELKLFARGDGGVETGERIVDGLTIGAPW